MGVLSPPCWSSWRWDVRQLLPYLRDACHGCVQNYRGHGRLSFQPLLLQNEKEKQYQRKELGPEGSRVPTHMAMCGHAVPLRQGWEYLTQQETLGASWTIYEDSTPSPIYLFISILIPMWVFKRPVSLQHPSFTVHTTVKQLEERTSE